MNITVLFGSPNPDGNTKKLLDIFISAIPGEVNTSVFSAYSLGVKPCIGCMHCRENHECIYSDLDDFFSSVLECDLFVIAAPQYFRALPSPVKAVIDRMQRFYGAPPGGRKIPGALLVCGGAEHADARIINAELYYSLPGLGIELTCTVTAANTDVGGISDEASKSAEMAAALVYDKYVQHNQEESI